MPDNTTRINAIRAILETGARSVNVDGVSVAVDPASLRLELERLQREDDVQKDRRPTAATILLN